MTPRSITPSCRTGPIHCRAVRSCCCSVARRYEHEAPRPPHALRRPRARRRRRAVPPLGASATLVVLEWGGRRRLARSLRCTGPPTAGTRPRCRRRAPATATATAWPTGCASPTRPRAAIPEDVHGPSEVIDPHGYAWRDEGWVGRPWHEAVIYELHIGTFTPEGSFAAARAKLPELAALGITVIELMPLADFPGRAQLGLRRRAAFRARHQLRHARRTQGAGRRRACASA